MKILFLTEKWTDCDPKFTLSSHYQNLFYSLSGVSAENELLYIHYDEIYYNTGKHFDEWAEDIVKQYSPDLVLSALVNMPGISPTKKTFNIIKNSGAKTVVFWPDTHPALLNKITELYDCTDLHVSWGNESGPAINNKHIWMWAPQDDINLFYKDTQDIDISFIGSLWQGYGNFRIKYIEYLLQNGINVFVSGGSRENKLSLEDYAKFIRQSKIGLNFSYSPNLGTPHQCKGRVFEIVASNSLLFESKNDKTSLRFIPNEHYIEFTNEKDLLDKTNYFLKNDKERDEIANNAHKFYMEHYSSSIYWKTIFETLGLI